VSGLAGRGPLGPACRRAGGGDCQRRQRQQPLAAWSLLQRDRQAISASDYMDRPAPNSFDDIGAGVGLVRRQQTTAWLLKGGLDLGAGKLRRQPFWDLGWYAYTSRHCHGYGIGFQFQASLSCAQFIEPS